MLNWRENKTADVLTFWRANRTGIAQHLSCIFWGFILPPQLEFFLSLPSGKQWNNYNYMILLPSPPPRASVLAYLLALYDDYDIKFITLRWVCIVEFIWHSSTHGAMQRNFCHQFGTNRFSFIDSNLLRLCEECLIATMECHVSRWSTRVSL